MAEEVTMQAAKIGSRIRQAREQRGLTLQHIASTTKISITALKAIERNDFEHLPGGVFNRAYVRACATEVGLNPDEIVREYRARFEPELPPLRPSGDRARLYGRVFFDYRFVAAFVMSLAILICVGLLLSRSAEVPEATAPAERGLSAEESDRSSTPRQPTPEEPQDAAGLDQS
jgi:cytoskeletal protein RodZ